MTRHAETSCHVKTEKQCPMLKRGYERRLHGLIWDLELTRNSCCRRERAGSRSLPNTLRCTSSSPELSGTVSPFSDEDASSQKASEMASCSSGDAFRARAQTASPPKTKGCNTAHISRRAIVVSSCAKESLQLDSLVRC